MIETRDPVFEAFGEFITIMTAAGLALLVVVNGWRLLVH